MVAMQHPFVKAPILCGVQTNLRMLLTVFTDSGAPVQRAGGAPRDNSLTLRVSTLGALDAKVYEQQSHQLRTEAEISNIVSQVYQAALAVVRAHASHALPISKELMPPTLPPESAWRDAVRALQDLINDGQKRLQVTSAVNLNAATVATPGQKKFGFELYTSFLRAIHAASTCATHVVTSQRDAVEQVQSRWLALASMSSYGYVTIQAGDQIASIVETVGEQVKNCLATVDTLRQSHVAQLKPVAMPLDVHINLCKSFLSQVRQWLLDFTSS